VTRFVFDEHRLGTANVFRLALFPTGLTYVSDAFVAKIGEAGLTGFAPTLVYE
jgi:hypothetical protein